MGRDVLNHPAHIRRSQRLGLFCHEIKKALVMHCLDKNVPIDDVGFFVEELFFRMENQDDEHDLVSLIKLLQAEGFLERVYMGYTDLT